MKKRVLSLFMALALCLTLLPTAALAEELEAMNGTPPLPRRTPMRKPARRTAKPLPCGCHRHDRSKGTGGGHTGEAAGTGNTACLVER